MNGVNTLYQERLGADYRAYAKWVLKPGASFPIDCFQSDQNSGIEFHVLSPAESRANAVQYGDNVGKITLVVFPEKRAGDKDAPGDKEATAVRRGLFPEGRHDNLEALQDDLLLSAEPHQVRGLIVVGTERKQSRIQAVDFEAAPDPVMSATISYYHPQ